jgi:hypothetical protein
LLIVATVARQLSRKWNPIATCSQDGSQRYMWNTIATCSQGGSQRYIWNPIATCSQGGSQRYIGNPIATVLQKSENPPNTILQNCWFFADYFMKPFGSFRLSGKNQNWKFFHSENFQRWKLGVLWFPGFFKLKLEVIRRIRCLLNSDCHKSNNETSF